MNRCLICGGAANCPADWRVFPPREGSIRIIHLGDPVPAGWSRTHVARGHATIVDIQNGLVVRALQAERIRKHFGFEPEWVGQCKYYVSTMPGEGGWA